MSDLKMKKSDFRASSSNRSSAMKTLMKYDSVRKALKHKSQQQGFYEDIKKNIDSGHVVNEKGIKKAIKKTLGKYLVDTKDNISTNKIKSIGKDLFGDTEYRHRFIISNKEVRTEVSENDINQKKLAIRRASLMEKRSSKEISTTSPEHLRTHTERVQLIGENQLARTTGQLSPSVNKGIHGAIPKKTLNNDLAVRRANLSK